MTYTLVPFVACDEGAADPTDTTTSRDTRDPGDSASNDDASPDTAVPDAPNTNDANDANTPGDTASTADVAGSDATTDTTTGPGIPSNATVSCLVEYDVATGFYFGAQKTCTAYAGAVGPTTKTYLEYECTTGLFSKLVPSCPEDGVVAYCTGLRASAEGNIEVTSIIYETPVNPSASFVSKNLPGICQALPQAFDAEDTQLSPTCSGTMKATIDGVETELDDKFTCIARTDGVRTAYLVRGMKNPATLDNQELVLSIVKDASSDAKLFNDLNQPSFGYLEGGTAAGAFAFPVAGGTPVFAATRFELDGTGFAATFSLGAVSTSPTSGGAQRTITNGSIDITFE